MALVIVSNTPLANEKDVVLQSNIVVTFNQAIITGSVTDDTFVVYSEGQTKYQGPGGVTSFDSDQSYNYTDTDYIEGAFQFSSDYLTATFVPTKSFKPNTIYNVLIGGYDIGSTELKYVRAQSNMEYLASSVKWAFTTGVLDVVEPPDKSEEIDYAELISQLDELTPGGLQLTPSGAAVETPTNGSFNVSLIDDTLITFISPLDILDQDIVPRVYLISIEDPLKTRIEVPCEYEIEGSRILRVKFA